MIAHGIAPDLATVGYLAALNPSDAVKATYGGWRASFARLQTKEAFPSDRQAFTFRLIEFLGICLGAQCIEGPSSDAVRWLGQLVPEQRLRIQGAWPRWLSSAAHIVLSGSDDLKDPVPTTDLSLGELALLIWLKLAEPFRDKGPWSVVELNQLRSVFLERCTIELLDEWDPARAAVVYASLRQCTVHAVRSELEERWQIGRPERDARELVENVCRRFHRVAQQVRERHDHRSTLQIADEYDVQDLMHSLLVMLFDDVRPETWTPNYAGNASRTDFILWAERIVVEVKMTRQNLKQREVSNQLIIDKERYKVEPRCQTLICFVYDPDGWCENPAALENDLAQDQSPRTIVIVHSSRS